MSTKNWYGMVLYSILSIALLLLLNNYISNSTMYAGKTHKIDHLYQELKQLGGHEKAITLVIGNSYVDRSFQEELAGEEFFKFSVAAMPLDDIIHLLENIPEGVPVNRALVGLGYNYTSPLTSNSYSYKKHTGSNVISRTFWSIPLIRSYSLSSIIIKEDLKCILTPSQGENCNTNIDEATKAVQKTSDKAPVDYDRIAQEKMDKSIKRRLEEFGRGTNVLSPQLTKKLDRLKEICEKREIQLIAYTAPIIKGVRKELNGAVLEQFRATIKNSVAAYTDLNLVYPDWDYTKFRDATHINYDASQITTNYLINFIENSDPH